MQLIYAEKVTLDLQKDLEILNTDSSPKIGEHKSNIRPGIRMWCKNTILRKNVRLLFFTIGLLIHLQTIFIFWRSK